MVMVKHLPRDSALQRELHGEAAEWSVTDHLLAATVDHLAVSNWMFMCVNSGEDGDQPDPPTPVPRPGGPDQDEDHDGADGTGTDEHGRSARAEESAAVSPHALARFFG
ncbi:hypothetical protein AMK27_21270 [Streptomyces sp. CB02009]|uniref:hypothetical protein n=2 Tax=Streptomyces TaxID=1883 RepID=UPI000939AE83|nr:hypothetical protein [Streptomyces sp. CB02009]OKJ60415.1 hypothetical protein AMK27_21270 [Streptomyces sp. CB02009]